MTDVMGSGKPQATRGGEEGGDGEQENWSMGGEKGGDGYTMEGRLQCLREVEG